jgi:hypothetical protein
MITAALQPVGTAYFRRQSRRALLASAIMAATVVVPHSSAGGVTLGADDLIALLLLLLLPLALVAKRDTPLAPATLLVGALWLAILVHGCLMGLASSAQYFGRPVFPTEMWQYVKRGTFFYAAFFIVSSQASIEPAYKALGAMLLVACLIGVVQIPSGAVPEFLSSLYARTDFQLEHLIERELATRRTYGVAGHPVAWGGFSVFCASVALPFVLVGSSRLKQPLWHFTATMLFVAATVNVLFAASRAAIAAFLAVFVLKGLLELSARRGGLRAFGKWLFSIALMVGAALYFALDRLAFLAFRLLTLADQAGGGRVDQVSSALALLDSASTTLTGVGNAVQRSQSVSHGVEVEPVYLLVNYGLIGTFCRYALLVTVAAMALRLVRDRRPWHSALGLSALLAICGYVVFSLGYFFFQELYVGVLPWLLFGLVAGAHQRVWLERHQRAMRVPDARPGLAADGGR